MNQNAVWKYLLLFAVVAGGVMWAMPNVFGDDPAIQISAENGEPLDDKFRTRVNAVLEKNGITPVATVSEGGRYSVRLADDTTQLRAADALKREVGRGKIIALDLASRTPSWMLENGMQPMSLGLDLRGGVHILLEVDIDEVRKTRMERYRRDIPKLFRNNKLRYKRRSEKLTADGVIVEFRDAAQIDEATKLVKKEFQQELDISVVPGTNRLLFALNENEAKEMIDFAVKKNLTTLRRRVNQSGVAEPIVQRQGKSRIVVQLPGVKDPTVVVKTLQGTATLEYRKVSEDHNPFEVQRTGAIPYDMKLYKDRDGNPVLLHTDIIVTGEDIIDATPTIDQDSNSPAVSVTLSGRGADKMFEFTKRNVDKPMAVVFKETRYDTRYNDQGEPVRTPRRIEEVISVASVREPFGKRFQTTGLESKEAHDLAILLRAGALAAPIKIIEERTIGPSLGQDNIDQGTQAVMIGFVAVIIFMAIYYRVFGLVANMALLLNLVLIVAVLSVLQATLTLPGIAGIVLTVGMAVDANVLIFERIREELNAGNTPQGAISAGYDKAFITIADANITTLIAALMLYVFGTGPIQGFAITLSIGIVTSMFTAIFGTRVIVNLIFGGRRMADLPI